MLTKSEERRAPAKTATSEKQTKLERSLRHGRDEMNLVEFPFAALSDRSTQQTLEFEVEEFDRERGYPVRRKLTVTGDPKYGLPTAKDEEVYLGLLQMTKLENNFASPAVSFSRGELLRVMGWKNKDWAYERVLLALQRLTGVRLFYTNAWRDNAQRSWTDKGGFGILESFRVRDSRLGKRAEKDSAEDSKQHSEFRWNSVLFESFQGGYLKRLDYLTVLQLGTTAKRLYRYLDKHFHPPKFVRMTFDLRVLALEHIGLSRDYDNAQIRRYLQPAVEELERIGFIKAVPVDDRYQQVSRGFWEVTFERTAVAATKPKVTRPGSFGQATTNDDDERRIQTMDRVVARYLEQKSEAERGQIEREAIDRASPLLRSKLTAEGPLAEGCRRAVLRNHVISLIKSERRAKQVAIVATQPTHAG